jgi:hypothetical protein
VTDTWRVYLPKGVFAARCAAVGMIDRVAYASLILEFTLVPVSDVGVRRSFFEGCIEGGSIGAWEGILFLAGWDALFGGSMRDRGG